MQTLEIVTEVFSRILNRPDLELKLNDSPKTIDGWDSLTHPEIITTIEEQLDIEFDFKELAGIRNVADLVTLIDKKQ